jgi:hypothetical protein
MLRGKINAEAPVCEIRLALPWSVAAYIAEHGEEIVATIQAAIGYRENVVARRERAAELDAARMAQQRRRWRELARVALRELRRHRATTPAARATVLCALAALTGGDMTAPALDLLATRRARELREKIRARRDRLIARLYFAGRTNAQIQSELRRFRYSGTSKALISGVLHRARRAGNASSRSIGDASPSAIAGIGDAIAALAWRGLADQASASQDRDAFTGPRAAPASLTAGEDPRDASLPDPGDVSPETSPPARPTRSASSGDVSPGSQRRRRARGSAR